MKSPSEVLAEDVGIMRAYELIAALRAADYIIVRQGAIGQAQDEAVRQYKADNDNRAALPVVGTFG